MMTWFVFFLCLFSFVSFVLRIKLKSDNRSALKKISGKLESLFIFYQFQWYPLYGEFTVSKLHSSVKPVSIKNVPYSNKTHKYTWHFHHRKHVRLLHPLFLHWLAFSHFLDQWFTLLTLKYLDCQTGLVMSSSASIHWSAFSKQQQILSWKSNKGSVPTIYR